MHPSSQESLNTGLRRRDFLKTAAGAALGLGLGLHRLEAEAAAPTGDRPNILWITMEDTSHQFLGCFGDKAVHTPNMDRLAAEGVRFINSFSTSPVCSPSRSTIITGCSAEELGTGHHRSRCPIPDYIKGFPYYLRQGGYYTTNNNKTDYNLSKEQEKHFVKEAWNECFGDGGWGTKWETPRITHEDTWDENAQEAGWWHRKAGQPFFSVFNLMNSHQSRTMTHPYDWYVEYVLNKLPKESQTSPDDITVPPFYRDTPEMRRHLVRVHNSLNLTDLQIGHILTKLEQDGLKDDTIVFCFADHGEGIPKGKECATGLSFQVPFFIYFPPKWQHLSPWPAGQPCEELVSTSEDVAPTILSLAGVDIPKHMTGRPLLGAQRKEPRPYVWCSRNRVGESLDISRCATDGRFFYTRVFMPQLPLIKFEKYHDVADIMRHIHADYNAGLLDPAQAELVKPQQPIEYLYDLHNDIWQIQNLANDPKYQSQLEALRHALQQRLIETRDIHFMPESEMQRRVKTGFPYEFRMDDATYPFARILAAANLIGTGPDAMAQQWDLMKDSDAIVRYWAAVGLDAQGEAIKSFEQQVMNAMADPAPSVRIVMAGIAYKQFGNPQAQQILTGFFPLHNEFISAEVLQTILYMRDQSKAFAPNLHAELKRPGMDGQLKLAIETNLHFLEGAPLYYPEFTPWVSPADKQPDPAVHFES